MTEFSAAWAAEQNSCNDWLGGRDSNPDRQIQSLQSYRWTTSQRRRKDFREQEVFNTAQQILSIRVFAVGASPTGICKA